MCIILTCDANRRPDPETIEACWETNPDGAGYAYATDDKVVISKGYMTLTELEWGLKHVPENAPLILHFRIGTSGGYGPEVTHPYPVTSSLEALHALDVEAPVAIAHNGVLPYPSDDAQGISDTVAYIMRVVSRVAGQRPVIDHGGLCKSAKARRTLRLTSKGSRLALIDAAGHLLRIGEGWETVAPGIYASNGGWRYKPVYASLYGRFGYYDTDYELPTYCIGCYAYEYCKETGPFCES